MNDVVVIGIGNPMRGDDGAGWVVIDHLERIVHKRIPLCKQKGDIAELIELFSSYSTVYLVDACSMEAPVGSWFRIDGIREEIPVESNQTSTHGFSISQALALAKNLDLLPSKLIVYVISGQYYAMNERLSPAVADASEQVALEILKEEDIHA